MKTLAGNTLTMLVFLFGACDGKSAGGAADAAYDTKSDKSPVSEAAFDTGLDGTRTLSTLTDTEKASICASGISYFSLSITRAEACRLLSVMNASGDASANSYDDATIQADCYNYAGSCPNETPTERDYYTPMCVSALACPCTVSDYETCVNDLRTALRQGMLALPQCEDLTAANTKSVEDPSMSLADKNKPVSCQALDAKCSGLTQTVLTRIFPAGYY